MNGLTYSLTLSHMWMASFFGRIIDPNPLLVISTQRAFFTDLTGLLYAKELKKKQHKPCYTSYSK